MAGKVTLPGAWLVGCLGEYSRSWGAGEVTLLGPGGRVR